MVKSASYNLPSFTNAVNVSGYVFSAVCFAANTFIYDFGLQPGHGAGRFATNRYGRIHTTTLPPRNDAANDRSSPYSEFFATGNGRDCV